MSDRQKLKNIRKWNKWKGHEHTENAQPAGSWSSRLTMETKFAEFLLENIIGINRKEFNENVISKAIIMFYIVTCKERYENIPLWLNSHFFCDLQTFIHPVGGCCRMVWNLGTHFLPSLNWRRLPLWGTP